MGPEGRTVRVHYSQVLPALFTLILIIFIFGSVTKIRVVSCVVPYSLWAPGLASLPATAAEVQHCCARSRLHTQQARSVGE